MWPWNIGSHFFMSRIENTEVEFKDLGISSNFLAVLDKIGYKHPTPIQHQVIPVAITGKDVVGIAQTGTGKTLAFSVPMIQQLGKSKGQGLVLLPTRELALQVDEVLQKIGRPLGLRTTVLIGGAAIGPQISQLRKNPHVIVATPGRLVDHLEQKTCSLEHVNIIVLDEADRMLDIGFMPQIKRILSVAPTERQTMLFSATMPQEIAKIASAHMKMPLRIEVAPAGTSSANVEQEMFIIDKASKIRLLDKLLADNHGTVLVFSRTKHGAKKIAKAVRDMGHTAAELHSNKSLAQRKAALHGFKNGTFRVLVATDIAARGIDVNNISLVINFDLPDNTEDYVHRIGRTGRAGNFGKAISFATHEEKQDIRHIERLIRKTLPILQVPTLPGLRPSAPEAPREERHFGGRGRRDGGRGRGRESSRGRGREYDGGRREGREERSGSDRGERGESREARPQGERRFDGRSRGRSSGARFGDRRPRR